uniref:Uncharacterized protein n=1 Tax=viral metagenome TaxID=1070528 RepID=A0A6C0ECK3_9ZZZZ
MDPISIGTMIAGAGIVTTVGKDLIVQSILSTTRGISSGIAYLFTSTSQRKEVKEIKILLEKLDIEAEVKVVEAFVKKLSEDKKDSIDVIAMALENLKNTVEKIEKELDEIKKKIEQENNTSYIGSWWYGYPDLTPNYNEIEKLSSVFKTRLDMLIKIVSSI